jgi:FkbM family methyltransferase
LLDRTDSVWYPNMRLYRQDRPGQDWSDVVNRIAGDLAVLAETKIRRPASTESRCQTAAPDRTHRASPAALPQTSGFNEIAPCRGGLMLYNRNDIYIGASLRKYGEFSRDEAELFRIIVSPGMTVLDIGANIGVHTVDLAYLVGSAGVVHAFEPQRLIFQTLCANMALNCRTNVFTHHAAVGAAKGTLLVPSLDPDGSHNYGGLSLRGAQQGEAVPVVTVDGLGLGVCHLIKLDVEGMETEALQGAAGTIARFRPILYVENDREARSVELISLIRSYRYRLYWHLPPLYSPNNFRADPENMFGNTISVNMLCLPVELQQSTLTGLREVTGPADIWYRAVP